MKYLMRRSSFRSNSHRHIWYW